MTNLFIKDKTYLMEEIQYITEQNSLVIVDCLKAENTITIEEIITKDKQQFLGGECLYVLKKIDNKRFQCIWEDNLIINRIFSNA